MKALILVGSLYQTVPEASIDSSQQQRFFHMTLEGWLEKNGVYLDASSDWRRNFRVPVKGQLLDPIEADNRRSGLCLISLVLGSAFGAGTGLLFIKSMLLGLVCLVGSAVGILALGFKAEELKPDSKNDLRWSLEAAVKNLGEGDPSVGLRVICLCGFKWTCAKAITALTALGSETDALDKAKTNPMIDSIELNTARSKMRVMFDDLKRAKLIPPDATYARYLPQPTEKK